MKISEFIKQFNKLGTIYDIRAIREDVFLHGILINKLGSSKYKAAARLSENSNDWNFCDNTYFSPEMLELMAELAKTPPEEREDVQKYVILNGMPRYGMCYYFSVDCDEGKLITSCVIGEDIEECASFSKERLREAKNALTPELATAVDMLTVKMERAIELTEQSKHGNLD